MKILQIILIRTLFLSFVIGQVPYQGYRNRLEDDGDRVISDVGGNNPQFLDTNDLSSDEVSDEDDYKGDFRRQRQIDLKQISVGVGSDGQTTKKPKRRGSFRKSLKSKLDKVKQRLGNLGKRVGGRARKWWEKLKIWTG